MVELLAMFKKSIGDFSQGTELDEYYTNFLILSQSQLEAEDISVLSLESNLGKFAIVLTAQQIMNDKSIADNNTIILLKNLLVAQTKGERYGNG